MVRPPSRDPVRTPEVESRKVEAENSCICSAETAEIASSKRRAYNIFMYNFIGFLSYKSCINVEISK